MCWKIRRNFFNLALMRDQHFALVCIHISILVTCKLWVDITLVHYKIDLHWGHQALYIYVSFLEIGQAQKKPTQLSTNLFSRYTNATVMHFPKILLQQIKKQKKKYCATWKSLAAFLQYTRLYFVHVFSKFFLNSSLPAHI